MGVADALSSAGIAHELALKLAALRAVSESDWPPSAPRARARRAVRSQARPRRAGRSASSDQARRTPLRRAASRSVTQSDVSRSRRMRPTSCSAARARCSLARLAILRSAICAVNGVVGHQRTLRSSFVISLVGEGEVAATSEARRTASSARSMAASASSTRACASVLTAASCGSISERLGWTVQMRSRHATVARSVAHLRLELGDAMLELSDLDLGLRALDVALVLLCTASAERSCGLTHVRRGCSSLERVDETVKALELADGALELERAERELATCGQRVALRCGQLAESAT